MSQFAVFCVATFCLSVVARCASTSHVLQHESPAFLTEANVVDRNEDLFPKNLFSKNNVYLFGALHPDADSATFTVNDRTITVGPLSYATNLSPAEGKTTIGGKGRYPNSSRTTYTEARKPTKSAKRPAGTAWRVSRMLTAPK